MSLDRDPALQSMAVELQAHIDARLRQFAEWAGVLCSGCELSSAVAVRAVGNGGARRCQGPVSPIRRDGRSQQEYDELERARQADASFSFSGNRCQVYQSPGDAYIMYKED